MTLISVNTHTHLAGISLDTRWIRNGVDIGYLFANHHYDFNYQETYKLNPPLVITKVFQIHFTNLNSEPRFENDQKYIDII